MITSRYLRIIKLTIVKVTTWAKLSNGRVAGGLPAAARDVLIGGSAPGVPSGLRVSNINAATAFLTWNAVPGAAGYSIQLKDLDTGEAIIWGTTSETAQEMLWMFPGTWHYAYCVHAYNGNLESACTAYVTPPVYPGFERHAAVEIGNGTEQTMEQGRELAELQKLSLLFDHLESNMTALESVPLS